MSDAWRQVGASLVAAIRETLGQVELKDQLGELREEVAALWQRDQKKPTEPSMQVDALAGMLEGIDQRLARMEAASAQDRRGTNASPKAPVMSNQEAPSTPKAKKRGPAGGAKTFAEQVIEAIGECGGSAKTADIVGRTGLNPLQVRNVIAKLRHAGVVTGTPVNPDRPTGAKVWHLAGAHADNLQPAAETPSKVIPMPPRPRRENELEEAVLEYLRDRSAPVSIENISKAVDIPTKKVDEIVEGFVEEMLVESDRRGVRLSRLTDEYWKLIKILKADGRPLPAMELAQRTHLKLARTIEILEALQESGRVEKRGERWRLGVVS